MMPPRSQPYRTSIPASRPPSRTPLTSHPNCISPFYPLPTSLAVASSSDPNFPPLPSPVALLGGPSRSTTFTSAPPAWGAPSFPEGVTSQVAASNPLQGANWGALRPSDEILGRAIALGRNEEVNMPSSSQLTHLSYSSPPSSQQPQQVVLPPSSGQRIKSRREGSVNVRTAGSRAAELMLAEMEDRRPWGDKLMEAHAETVESLSKLQEACSSLSADEKTVRDQVYGLLSSVKALPTKDDIMEDLNAQMPLLLETGLQAIVDKLDAISSHMPAPAPYPITADILTGHLERLQRQIQTDLQSLAPRPQPDLPTKPPIEDPMMRLMTHLVSSLEPIKSLQESLSTVQALREVLPALELLPQAVVDVATFQQAMKDLSDKMTNGMEAIVNSQKSAPASGVPPILTLTPNRDEQGIASTSALAPPILQSRPGMRFSVLTDSPEVGAEDDLNPYPISPTLHPSLRSPLGLPPRFAVPLPNLAPLLPPKLTASAAINTPVSISINPAKFKRLCDDAADLRGTVNVMQEKLHNPPIPSWLAGLESKIDCLVQGVEEVGRRPISCQVDQDKRTPSLADRQIATRTPVSNPPRLTNTSMQPDSPFTPLQDAALPDAGPEMPQDNPADTSLPIENPQDPPSQDVFGPVQDIAPEAVPSNEAHIFTSIADRAKNLKRPVAKRKLTGGSATSSCKKRKSTSVAQKSTSESVLSRLPSGSASIQGMVTRSRSRSAETQNDSGPASNPLRARNSTTTNPPTVSNPQTELTTKNRSRARGSKPPSGIVNNSSGGDEANHSTIPPAKSSSKSRSKTASPRSQTVIRPESPQALLSENALSETQHSQSTQESAPTAPLPDGGKPKDQVTGVTTSESSSDDSRASDFEATERNKRAAAAKKKTLGNNRSRGSMSSGCAGLHGLKRGKNVLAAVTILGFKGHASPAGELLKEIQRDMSTTASSSVSTGTARTVPESDLSFASTFLPPPLTATSEHHKKRSLGLNELDSNISIVPKSRFTFSNLVHGDDKAQWTQAADTHPPLPARANSSVDLTTLNSNRELNNTQSRTLETQNSAGAQPLLPRYANDLTQKSAVAGHHLHISRLESQSIGFPVSNVRGGFGGARAVTYGGRRLGDGRPTSLEVPSDSEDSITMSDLEA